MSAESVEELVTSIVGDIDKCLQRTSQHNRSRRSVQQPGHIKPYSQRSSLWKPSMHSTSMEQSESLSYADHRRLMRLQRPKPWASSRQQSLPRYKRSMDGETNSSPPADGVDPRYAAKAREIQMNSLRRMIEEKQQREQDHIVLESESEQDDSGVCIVVGSPVPLAPGTGTEDEHEQLLHSIPAATLDGRSVSLQTAALPSPVEGDHKDAGGYKAVVSRLEEQYKAELSSQRRLIEEQQDHLKRMMELIGTLEAKAQHRESTITELRDDNERLRAQLAEARVRQMAEHNELREARLTSERQQQLGKKFALHVYQQGAEQRLQSCQLLGSLMKLRAQLHDADNDEDEASAQLQSLVQAPTEAKSGGSAFVNEDSNVMPSSPAPQASGTEIDAFTKRLFVKSHPFARSSTCVGVRDVLQRCSRAVSELQDHCMRLEAQRLAAEARFQRLSRDHQDAQVNAVATSRYAREALTLVFRYQDLYSQCLHVAPILHRFFLLLGRRSILFTQDLRMLPAAMDVSVGGSRAVRYFAKQEAKTVELQGPQESGLPNLTALDPDAMRSSEVNALSDQLAKSLIHADRYGLGDLFKIIMSSPVMKSYGKLMRSHVKGLREYSRHVPAQRKKRRKKKS